MRFAFMKKMSVSCMLVMLGFFCLYTGVEAEEKNDRAESFRYVNGKEKESPPVFGVMNVNAWKRDGDAFYNNRGQAIPGAYAMGIDVSSNNGSIDWNAVKADGVEFAIIRCGYGMNQPEQDDKRWQENVAGCEAAGIPYGVYLYSYADSVSRAVSEAEHVLRLVAGRSLAYPVYFDMEDQSIFRNTTAKQRVKIAEAFCKKIEAAGYKAAIYANHYAFTNELPEKNFNRWGRWVAHFAPKCGYKGKYQMWQATNQGRIAGIQGNVDVNFMISDLAAEKPVIHVVSAGKKKVKVSWKPKKKGTTCQIYYSRTKKGKGKLVTKNAGKGWAKIRKLKSGKTYYFRVRLSRKINGVTVCSKYSKSRKLKAR